MNGNGPHPQPARVLIAALAFGRAMCRTLAAAVLAAVMLTAVAAHAGTLVVPDDELPKLKACEQRLCTMILNKEPAGDDFQCRASKTWAQETIKGGENKTVRWGFGDAHCKLNFTLARSDIVSALTKAEFTLNIPSQSVKCEVDREGELKPVTAKLAPKIIFKNGQAEKIWINLTELNGPADIKGPIWTAANLEDTLGIFHASMIKSVNKFLYKRCYDTYSPAAMALALRKKQIQERRAAAKAKAAGQSKPQSPQPAKPASAKLPAPAAATAPAEPDAEPPAANP